MILPNKITSSHKRVLEPALSLYQEALAYLYEFEAQLDKPNKAKLTLAANKLHESLKLDSAHVQPYVCLAYICYLLDDKALSLEYLALAEDIHPDFPPVQALKAEIG